MAHKINTAFSFPNSMKERHRLYRKHMRFEAGFSLLVTVMIAVSHSPFFWKCRQYNLHPAVGSGNSNRPSGPSCLLTPAYSLLSWRSGLSNYHALKH